MNKTSMRRWIAMTAAWMVVQGWALGSDWPQWRGPNRDGTTSDPFAFSIWPPIELWKVPLTDYPRGYSSPIVSEGRVYVMSGRYEGYPSASEVISCFDARTGGLLWTNGWISTSSCGGGPGSTPVVNGGELYAMSNDGRLRCLNKYTGSNLWSVALGGTDHCASPWVEGDLVFVNVGANGVAVRRTEPHDIVWASTNGPPGYASPVAWTDDHGQRRIGIFSQIGFHVVNPLDGTVLAQTPWPGNRTIPDPIVWGNRLFLATGDLSCYSGLVEYTNGMLRTVWQNPQNVGMNTKAGNFVRIGDYVYGACYLSSGAFRCLRLSDGQEMWSVSSNVVGNMSTTMAVGNRLVYAASNGGLYVAKATPAGFDMEGRSPINVVTEVTPAFADGRLYVRGSWLRCLDTGPQNDLDRDQIADKWETNYFGAANVCVAGADPDGDGLNNLQEYLAGTDPTNRNSCLIISDALSQTNGVVFHWQSATGKTYSIHCSTNLVSDPFTNRVIGGVPAHPPENVYTDTVPRPDTVFYRIELEP